ncbi:MAG: outer membrane lipoprotein-sorting protein, partial [Gammaproteobacteria bacterium]|nr:outer membrane lipoprotein-sorting protein [Gammaproteobacteria bacterium]
LLKTLTYSDYKQYLGQYWRADNMKMENHQTGKSTVLSWIDYQFKTGLTDKDFSRNSLKSAK